MALRADRGASWSHALARGGEDGGSSELTAILAGSPPGVLSLAGGFPNARTFATGVIDEIAARVVREDAAVALQYTPCEGIPSVREYLLDRQEQLQGRRPPLAELIVTSGGMECITLACRALIDPGDPLLVEDPTYLGALMAFDGFDARVEGVPMDAGGLRIDALAERLATGPPPKLLYVIPEYQNPTGRTLPLDRREALVELCRRHRVLILEDIAYRELAFDGTSLPTLWSLAPDVVVQAGTFSKVFFPGVRLGWAVGPAEVIARMAAAKQTTDQCSGGLGQRMFEEYVRRGWIEEQLVKSRALYRSKRDRLLAALERTMPPDAHWTRPQGGFFFWLTIPGCDTTALAAGAAEAGVGIVPGSLFYADGRGGDNVRLSFSQVDESLIDEGIERLASLLTV